jgi:hypothetical protein
MNKTDNIENNDLNLKESDLIQIRKAFTTGLPYTFFFTTEKTLMTDIEIKALKLELKELNLDIKKCNKDKYKSDILKIPVEDKYHDDKSIYLIVKNKEATLNIISKFNQWGDHDYKKIEPEYLKEYYVDLHTLYDSISKYKLKYGNIIQELQQSIKSYLKDIYNSKNDLNKELEVKQLGDKVSKLNSDINRLLLYL